MTISSYQVDNVIKAYMKQTKVKVKNTANLEAAKGSVRTDTVSLSTKETKKEDAYEKISYNLMDIILKKEGR